MQLVLAAERGASILLAPGEPAIIGRGPLLGLTNPVLSRRHVSLIIEDSATVVVTAHSPVTLVRRPAGIAAQQPQQEQLAPDTSAALRVGDSLFLLRTPQGLRYGYQLACLVDGRLCTAPPPAAAAPPPAAPAVVSPVAATEPAAVAASQVDDGQVAAEAAAAEVEAAEARAAATRAAEARIAAAAARGTARAAALVRKRRAEAAAAAEAAEAAAAAAVAAAAEAEGAAAATEAAAPVPPAGDDGMIDLTSDGEGEAMAGANAGPAASPRPTKKACLPGSSSLCAAGSGDGGGMRGPIVQATLQGTGLAQRAQQVALCQQLCQAHQMQLELALDTPFAPQRITSAHLQAALAETLRLLRAPPPPLTAPAEQATFTLLSYNVW